MFGENSDIENRSDARSHGANILQALNLNEKSDLKQALLSKIDLF